MNTPQKVEKRDTTDDITQSAWCQNIVTCQQITLQRVRKAKPVSTPKGGNQLQNNKQQLNHDNTSYTVTQQHRSNCILPSPHTTTPNNNNINMMHNIQNKKSHAVPLQPLPK
jgi:hypothetical protein